MMEALHEAEGLEEVEGAVDGDRGQVRVDGPTALEELGRRRAVWCHAQRLHDRAPGSGVGATGAGEACQEPARLAVAVKLKLFFNFHGVNIPRARGRGQLEPGLALIPVPGADTVDPPCAPAAA